MRILVLLTEFLLLTNVICYLTRFKRNNFSFKIFTIYLIYIFTIQVWQTYLAAYKMNNLFITHFYFIGQFVFLSVYFKKNITNKYVSKIIYPMIAIVLPILSWYLYTNPQKHFEWSNFETIITSFPLIIYSLSFLLERIDSKEKKNIYITTGLFIYLLCSTLLFLNGNIRSEFKILVWVTNIIMFSFYQALIFIEWYKNYRMLDVSRLE